VSANKENTHLNHKRIWPRWRYEESWSRVHMRI
jgi:hypothetical protein